MNRRTFLKGLLGGLGTAIAVWHIPTPSLIDIQEDGDSKLELPEKTEAMIQYRQDGILYFKGPFTNVQMSDELLDDIILAPRVSYHPGAYWIESDILGLKVETFDAMPK